MLTWFNKKLITASESSLLIISEYLDLTIHKFDSDIAGIGRLARANFLTWEEFENYKWLEKYKNSKYDIDVETSLNVSQVISHKVKNTEI